MNTYPCQCPQCGAQTEIEEAVISDMPLHTHTQLITYLLVCTECEHEEDTEEYSLI